MSFEELWEVVKQKNPKMDSGKVNMSVESFKKALKLAYDQGAKQKEKDSNFSNMFEDLLKKGKNGTQN